MDTFSTSEWLGLTYDERLAHCRMAARESEALAEKAEEPKMREIYQHLAAQWHMLADEMERHRTAVAL